MGIYKNYYNYEKPYISVPHFIGICLSQAKVISTSEGCPTVLLQKCYGQIASVIEECEDLTNLFGCISDILGTASDCLPCICDILELIPGIEVSDCPEK